MEKRKKFNENVRSPVSEKNVKMEMEIEGNDEEETININESKLMTTDIKKEFQPSYDPLSNCNENKVMFTAVNEESTTLDDIKIKTEDHIIFAEPLSIDGSEDFDRNAPDMNNMESDETMNMKINNESHTSYERLHKCKECIFTTHRKDCLNKHMLVHNRHKVQKFYCDYCSFYTIRKGNLERHKSIHNPVKPFQCKFCQKYFHHSSYLKVHMDMHHPEECKEKKKMFQCHKCPYKSIHNRDLVAHKIKHGDTENLPEYSCEVCEFSTYYKSVLKRHNLIHTGEKPYVCEQCQYSCRNSSCLKVHIKRHHKKN